MSTGMSESQRWWLLALTVLFGGLIYLLAPVLTPFLAGALLAYIGDPLVDRLEARGLSRTLSVVVVFLTLTLVGLLLLLVLVPMLERQVGLLIQRLPGYLEWLFHTGLPGLLSWAGLERDLIDLGAIKSMLSGWLPSAGKGVAGVLGTLSRSGMTLIGWIANLLLIPVVTFYLLRDWDLMVARIRELLPRRWEPDAVRLASASDEVLGAFFRGQLLVMLVLALVYGIGLTLVGLELGLLIGLIAGLVSFVPYLGFIVGIVAATIAALLQFKGIDPLIWVALVFGVGQLLEGMVLQPLLLGERIGLHPVAVLFAVLAGGQLFGFFGVLLALPVAAVVAVVLRYLHERYLESGLYGAEKPAEESGS